MLCEQRKKGRRRAGASTATTLLCFLKADPEMKTRVPVMPDEHFQEGLVREGEAGRGRGGWKASGPAREEGKEQSRANTARAAEPAPGLSSRDLPPNSREILGRGNKEKGAERGGRLVCAVASVRAIWGERLERRWRRRHWLCSLKDLLHSCSLKCPVKVVRSSGVWAPTGYPVGCMCGGGGRSELGLLRKTTRRTAFS